MCVFFNNPSSTCGNIQYAVEYVCRKPEDNRLHVGMDTPLKIQYVERPDCGAMLLHLLPVSFGTQFGISAPTPTGGCSLLFCWCVVDVFDLIFSLLSFSFVLCTRYRGNDDGSTGNHCPRQNSPQVMDHGDNYIN